MSYTSKYTGQEIDELLDSIGQTGGSVEQIFNGKAGVVGSVYTLDKSVDSYDLILVQGGATEGVVAIDSLVFNPEDLTDKADDHQFMLNKYSTDQYNFRIMFGFDNRTSFRILVVNNTGWGAPAITQMYGIKLSSSALGASSSNPIGAIVPIMGTQAPKDHLVCDGAVLNISEYKELADYFEKQFGSNSYFGGDGITTFAVPDLRNEFLRGYHGDAEEQLSGEIGVHQNATEIPIYDVDTNGAMFVRYNKTERGDGLKYYDTTTGVSDAYTIIGGAKEYNNYVNAYTSRPTNVAVLFCIKYTESGSTNGGSGYKEVDLINEPVEYTLAHEILTTINQDLVFNDSVLNYDEIVFVVDVYNIEKNAYYSRKDISMSVSEITYSNSDNAGEDGDAFYIDTSYYNANSKLINWYQVGAHWKNETTLRIRNTYGNSASYTKFRIKAVKGIKY